MRRQQLNWITYVGREIQTSPVPQATSRKPTGLWASVGGYWKSWCEYNSYTSGVKYTHKYALTFDPSHIITLDTPEDVRVFNAEFLEQDTSVYRGNASPNWAKVARRYAGVEVLYPMDLEDHAKWIWGWDLSSLCIWDASLVEAEELELDWDGSVRRLVYD